LIHGQGFGLIQINAAAERVRAFYVDEPPECSLGRYSRHGHYVFTVIRLLRMIAGFIRIVLPRQMASVATTIYSGSIAMTIVGVIVLVLGGYLSFEGYRPVSN
jgi:hypothetical protein